MTASVMTPKQREALERLIGHAKRDSGQAAKVADFLLAWWNAGSCGGFDLTDVWPLDDDIAADVVTVFGLVANLPNLYPDRLGYGDDFAHILRVHRPDLVES